MKLIAYLLVYASLCIRVQYAFVYTSLSTCFTEDMALRSYRRSFSDFTYLCTLTVLGLLGITFLNDHFIF